LHRRADSVERRESADCFHSCRSLNGHIPATGPAQIVIEFL